MVLASIWVSFFLTKQVDLSDWALARDFKEPAEQQFRVGIDLAESQPETAKICFKKAADDYRILRWSGISNPSLFCNQGNAYLLANELPRAILAYRRGLRLDPTHRDLRANLAYARDQVVFPSPDAPGRPPIDHRPPWLPRLDSPFVFFPMLVLYTVGWLLFTRWIITRRGGFLTAAVVTWMAAAILGTGFVLDERRQRWEEQYPVAVIASDGVKLRKGNGYAYPARLETSLSAGVEARLLFARGDWLQIELSGGEVGWVRRTDAVVDE